MNHGILRVFLLARIIVIPYPSRSPVSLQAPLLLLRKLGDRVGWRMEDGGGAEVWVEAGAETEADGGWASPQWAS